MYRSSQLTPTGARNVVSGARWRDDGPAYVLPHVRERPLRLEPVAADSFGGLLTSHPRLSSRAHNHQPEGALS